jgi:hypothetical protein
MKSKHDVAGEVGTAHSSEEAGQRPWSQGAVQGKLFGEGITAAPEADLPVSPKLAELVARARKEGRLTNVVQFVDEELLRLAFRSLRKQAAPGVDGQRYEDYAANLDHNLKDLYQRLRTGRYRAPVVRRVYIPKASGSGRRPLGSPRSKIGWSRRRWPGCFRRCSSRISWTAPTASGRGGVHGAASTPRGDDAALGQVRRRS